MQVLDGAAPARPLRARTLRRQEQSRPGAYEPWSVYFALRAPDGEVLGGLQLVRGNGAGVLPYRSVWPELALEGRTDVADVAVLALKQEYRGRGDLF